jgi:hypothetical protein
MRRLPEVEGGLHGLTWREGGAIKHYDAVAKEAKI